MNELVKVYGHRRSGNNLLCSLLYYNFFPDMDLRSKDDPVPTKFCTLPDGSKEKYSPWGGLFGSYDILPTDWTVDLDSAIYIKRNPTDTAMSLMAFQESIGKPMTNKVAVYAGIAEHQYNWSNACYTVKYEDLVKDPLYELLKIGIKFKLDRVPDEWWIPDRKIGWNPRD